ncbi:MAG TPA: S8 family serine peptidase [Vicinamibacterales bacterium]
MPLRVPKETLKKIQPKLRMIADGDSVVNVVRAERCGALAVENKQLLRDVVTKRGAHAAPVTLADLRVKPKPRALSQITRDVLANVFVYLRDSESEDLPAGNRPYARRGRIAQVQARLSDLPKLASRDSVAYVEIAEALKAPTPSLAELRPAAPSPSLRRFGKPSAHRYGEGVLIGIIDVQGFDFAHPDFLDHRGRTRFVRIWDQGGDSRPGPHETGQFSYGAEFRDTHLNAAIAASPALGLPATDIEKQSQMVEGSHGTHVASIAAGNRGVCRRSQIAGVLISLPRADEDRRKSFYDSSRLADAVDYLLALGDELGLPVSINISLGTNGHSHDGSAAVTRWIDAALATPGRAITVAAGNAGQERGETDDDLGWIMGRIHSSGAIPAAGLVRDLEWVVVGNGVMDVSENEMEIWFNAQDRIAVSIKPPGKDWIGPVEPREFMQNRMLADGTMLSIYNEVFHPANGLNYASLYLSPFFAKSDIIGVAAGTWLVRLHAREIRDGRYHAWIERDDPHRLGRVGQREAWAFPSFFTQQSLVDNTTVSSLGCATRVITVANLDAVRNRISISSSQGPTRDGRQKPDVAAPGTAIAAAKGFADRHDQWLSLSGTSMASPFVTGVIGLMLAMNPRLTAAQIEGIIRRSATPLPGASFEWANDAGFGVIDPDACLREVALVNERTDLG